VECVDHKVCCRLGCMGYKMSDDRNLTSLGAYRLVPCSVFLKILLAANSSSKISMECVTVGGGVVGKFSWVCKFRWNYVSYHLEQQKSSKSFSKINLLLILKQIFFSLKIRFWKQIMCYSLRRHCRKDTNTRDKIHCFYIFLMQWSLELKFCMCASFSPCHLHILTSAKFEFLKLLSKFFIEFSWFHRICEFHYLNLNWFPK
jgi:hypothetical protein